MENYSPLCTYVDIFEGFLFGNCNMSVSLAEYFSQGLDSYSPLVVVYKRSNI